VTETPSGGEGTLDPKPSSTTPPTTSASGARPSKPPTSAGLTSFDWFVLALSGFILPFVLGLIAIDQCPVMRNQYLVYTIVQLVIIEWFLFRFIRLPIKGHVSPKFLAATEQRRADIRGLIEESQAQERNLIGTIEQLEQADYVRQKIFAAIDYAIKRHDWLEEQRTRILGLSVTAATIIVAAIAIFVKTGPIDIMQGLSLGALLAIAVLSLCRMVLLYNAELDAHRPYRIISDIRFWYFKYLIPSPPARHDDPIELAKSMLQDRQKYVKSLRENLELSKSIREDVEQIFILQVLQRYKSESLTRMRHLLLVFTVFGSMQACVYFVLLLLSRVIDGT
jgi:hypothetical protein